VYATSVFYYTQRQIVVLLTGFSPRKYMPVYAKPLTLHKGVDNQIQFQFLNQEQKPVDITGKEITCRIISYDGTTTLIQKALTLQLAATGIAALYLGPADLENIVAQKAYYSLEIPVGAFDFPVFVDQNAGARGDMNIVNSVLPSFIPSAEISIPTGQPFPNLANANLQMSNVNGYTYTTSVFETNDNPVLTIQVNYNEFYGNVIVQGSTIPDGDWYPVQLHSYANTSATEGYVVTGYHPYIRVSFTSNSGQVDKVLSR
jgi:hypothetical protein